MHQKPTETSTLELNSEVSELLTASRQLVSVSIISDSLVADP